MSIILCTDSYKLTHWNQYPKGCENVYSYFEARKGATYPETVFFGLQAVLDQINFLVEQFAADDIDQAEALVEAHLGDKALFNRKGWEHILDLGYLPIHIKAVPEGLPIPVGNVLMTVENTDDQSYWATNYLETLLTHVWYPSTVATLSRSVKTMIAAYLDLNAGHRDGLPFMLHDFGFRGATSLDAAGIGGAGHLVNFMGTDTIPAMMVAHHFYDASLENLAFSVPATEHSIMTAGGRAGEMGIVDDLIAEYPGGILSVVADSYDIYEFVGRLRSIKDKILSRDGVFVVRPDSCTDLHETPEALTTWIVQKLDNIFGSEVNQKGYKVLDSHVRVLWGDGINPQGIQKILGMLSANGYSAENMVFGMGGGLLQKVNRDTQRFAFKCSAQKVNGEWIEVRKTPIDMSKASKGGRLKLVREDGVYNTVAIDAPGVDIMETVYDNGEMHNRISFDQVRKNAEI